jgi:hypothetical protein
MNDLTGVNTKVEFDVRIESHLIFQLSYSFLFCANTAKRELMKCIVGN